MPLGIVASALFCVCATGVDAQSALRLNFKTYDVSGALQTWLTGVNDSGVIVGWYLDQQGNAHGFTLTNGNFRRLDNRGGDRTATVLSGINSSGDIVGSYHNSCAEEVCWEGFVYRNGTFSDLGPPFFLNPGDDDSPDSEALGINDRGRIVGSGGDGFGAIEGFLKRRHHYRALQVPGANGEQATSINKAGLVTLAYATNNHSGVSLYDGGTYRDIGVPNAVDTYQGAINNRGEIVLGFDAGLGQPIHGSLLRNGTYHTFDDPKSTYMTLPFGLNDQRTIVGIWNDGQQNVAVHGFIATY